MTDGVLPAPGPGAAPPTIDQARRGGVGGDGGSTRRPPGGFPSSVLTADVTNALSAVLEAQAREAGAAFFLVGHFGSGKSHLLAAIAELAEAPVARMATAGARACGKRPVEPGRRWPLPYPWWSIAPPPCSRTWCSERPGAPWAGPRPLRAPTGGPPGTGVAAAAEAAASRRGAGAGLVVLLDELSEFLRAKQGPALVEDLRFLRFLGEWARESPVVVVAALQESIEEVANVSQRELARIRDRYRTLGLSMRHVEDLVRGRLVRLRPGAEPWVERAHREIEGAFPSWGVLDRLRAATPCTRRRCRCWKGCASCSPSSGASSTSSAASSGGASAGITPWQGRGYLELGHARPGLRPLPLPPPRAGRDPAPGGDRRAVLRAGGRGDPRRAGRPGARDEGREAPLPAGGVACRTGPKCPRVANLLLTRLSALDPSANVAYLERAVPSRSSPVAPMWWPSRAAPGLYGGIGGRHGRGGAGPPGPGARRGWRPADRRVVRTLVELGSSLTLPLHLLADVGPARREFLWQNTLPVLLVVPVRIPELGEPDITILVAQARALGAEGCLLVAEPETRPGIWSPGRHLSASERAGGDLGPAAPRRGGGRRRLELLCRRLVLEQARAEGRNEAGGLVEFLERSSAGDEARAREALQRAPTSPAWWPRGRGGGGRPAVAGGPVLRARARLPRRPAPVRACTRCTANIAPRRELVGERLLRQLVVDVSPSPASTAAAAERGRCAPCWPGTWCPSGSSGAGAMPTCCRPIRCAARRWPRCCASFPAAIPSPRRRSWPRWRTGRWASPSRRRCSCSTPACRPG